LRELWFGNDGNEFKIITQVFLYKFLNDKFAHEIKRIEPALAKADSWEAALRKKSKADYEMLLMQLGASTARLKPSHFLGTLFARQNDDNFAALFDSTLLDIAKLNSDIFSVKTNDGKSIVLFDAVTKYVDTNSDDFARAIINKLVPKKVRNVTCNDPAAGTGTLLMNLAHAIGEDRCTIYTQDISQKSSSLLRLNLILNNLVHSIPNVIQGNTILEPYHKEDKGTGLRKFKFIVSNPPFKLDFSDFRDQLDTPANKKRFFAGIPKVPNKDKDKMAIYLLFIQHIIHSLESDGRAAIVVPTGFITAKSGIEKAIRQHLVQNKMLGGVISMPSNIFATTGTNVSILFIDAANKGDVVLIDASGLGEKVKEGKNQKTLLSVEDEQLIIDSGCDSKLPTQQIASEASIVSSDRTNL